MIYIVREEKIDLICVTYVMDPLNLTFNVFTAYPNFLSYI